MKPDSGAGKMPVGGQLRTLSQKQRQKQTDQLRSCCPELRLSVLGSRFPLASCSTHGRVYVSVLSFN